MSTNCIKCGTNERTGLDLLCDGCREINRLRAWVDDLQSKMYVNCVFCGHRYGPETHPPMMEALRSHIKLCPAHPTSHLLKASKSAIHALSSIIACRDGITNLLLNEVRDALSAAMMYAGEEPPRF